MISINSKKNKLLGTAMFIVLSAVLFVVMLPFMYAFFGSFKTTKEILAGSGSMLPEKFLFSNYVEAWEKADFKRYTWNSVYFSFFLTLTSVITSTMGGYVFARGNFPGKKITFAILTATMFVSLGTISIYPTLQIARLFKINNSLWGVIILRIFSLHVSNMYIVKGFVDSLPKEIDESAKMDGCGFFRIFAQIVFPLLKPAVATIAILSFKNAWNDYLLPMVFTMANPKNAPLPVGLVALKGQADAAASWNLILAGAMISIIPIVMVYLSFNRYFLSGITAGSVKG